MTDRRVKVTVDADYSGVIDGSGEAVVAIKATQEEMKSLDKQIEETGRDMDKLAAETALAKKEVESLGLDAEVAKKGVTGLGTESKETGKSVGGLSDRAKALKADLEALDARLKASRKSVQDLGLEFARTGSKADQTAFNRERSVLARLERLRKDLTAAGDSKGVGRGVLADAAGVAVPSALAAGKGFAETFAEGFKGGLKGPMIAGLVVAAAAIAPGIGAIIAGAVTGVVGLGGVAGGLFAASKDQRVRTAASDLGNHISKVFFASGESFVGPIQQSVAFLKHDFDALDLKSTFALAAPFVTEFAHGLSGIVSEFLPGFNQALVKGKPAIDLFASRLPEIGKDIGDMLSKLAGSEGTLEGVNALFNVLSETIHFVGTSVAWLGDRFHDFNHDADATFSWLSKVTAWLGDDEDSKALKQTADDFKALSDGAQQGAIHFATYAGEAQYATAITAQMGKETSDTTDYMKDFRDAMIASQQAIDDWINKALGLSDANIAVAQDFADLNDKLNRGKRFWDMNTQGGRDNLKLMNDTIGDLERQRLQAIATSDGSRAAIDKINQAFNANIDLLEKQAIKAGDTKAAFEAMAGSYRITIITDILNAAAAAKQSKTDKSSRFAGFASGGTTPAYAPFVVGEHGPEVLWDSKQHYVETKAMAQQSAMPWSGGGSSGGAGGTVTHVIDLQLNGRTIRTLLIGDGTARGVSKVDLADKYP